jgi:RNA polymerase sigma-70 factor (ECF subfamily)
MVGIERCLTAFVYEPKFQNFLELIPHPTAISIEAAQDGDNPAIVRASVEMAFRTPNSFLLANDRDEPSPEAAPLQDSVLLAAFAGGDRNAFAELYRRHARPVFQFALYIAGDPDSADEITQEVFVWLIDHPAAFDPTRGTLPAFLGGVARKFLRRQLRARGRWSPLQDALHSLQAIGIARGSALGTDSVLDAAQLRRAIALLPLRYREPIVLCDLQEKGYAEAAHILGCSLGTIRSRLHRGRNLLARKLNPSSNQGGRNAL